VTALQDGRLNDQNPWDRDGQQDRHGTFIERHAHGSSGVDIDSCYHCVIDVFEDIHHLFIESQSQFRQHPICPAIQTTESYLGRNK
jgi:hypothetical protein